LAPKFTDVIIIIIKIKRAACRKFFFLQLMGGDDEIKCKPSMVNMVLLALHIVNSVLEVQY
jgi:hypothetical protein